jgi:ABC-type transport system involved in multi-copper enzyme maturation permease subunit
MSTVSKATGQHIPPPLARRDTVYMGRLDFLSVIVRLTGVELYKFRRRTMSKVMGTLCVLAILAVFGVFAIGSISTLATPATSFLPASCSQGASPSAIPCPDHASLPAAAAAAKQAELNNISQPLRLPDSLGVAAQTARDLDLLLVIILAGTIIGGEYSVGTIRLMLTRGPTRTQFFLSKIGAVSVCLALGFLGMTLLGVVLGALFNLITGIPIDFSFLTAAWLLHAALYLLVSMLGLFVYAMLALCLATLGRATAAGVAGALVWWVLENALGGVFALLGTLIKGQWGSFLQAVPDYFIARNVDAPVQNQSHFILLDQPSTLSDLHALLVVAGYLVVFIGLTWWVIRRRDIAN